MYKTMKTLTSKLDTLNKEAQDEIRDLINSKGEKSRHNSNKCLKVTKGEHQYNLDGGRYLTEVHTDRLVDNNGYEYDFCVLNTEDFFATIDYLKEKYK